MKNAIAMRLFSRRVLTPQASADQISMLSRFGSGVFCPDLYGSHEPLRTPFDRDDIQEPVLGLSKPHGVFLCKKGRPLQVRGAIWNLYSSPRLLRDDSGSYISSKPAPTFCTHWTFEFDSRLVRKVDIETATKFAEEMFDCSGSDFGFVTTLEDLESKNYLHKVTRCGLDPAEGVPGLYWMNMFSAEYARWLRVEQLPPDVAHIHSFGRESVAIKFGTNVENVSMAKTLLLQEKAIGILGRNRFFDITAPERKLEVPEWARLMPMTQVVN